MRGRHVLMDTLAAHGVEYLFGNPGTTESPVMDSLADHPGIRYILALHEGVALGAAHYYAQASGRTGVVNLHVAPGLGNALGLLYGALKSGAPLLVTAGQQDTRLRLRDPVLGHDLVAMVEPVTKWSLQVERADELGLALHRALKVAHDPPTGPVFLALPIDVLEQETEQAALPPGRLYREPAPDPAGVAAAAEALLAARSPAIVAGDEVTRSGAQDDLVALAEASGAGVWVEGLRQQVVFPTAHPCFRGALPFDAVAIRQALGGVDLVLLVGGPFFEEVWWAPGPPLPPEARLVHLEAAPDRLARNFRVDVGLLGGIRPGLAALRREVDSRATAGFRQAAARRLEALRAQRAQDQAAQASRAQRRWDRVPVSMPRLMAEVRQALPPGAIVVDEAITASLDLARTLTFKAPGDYYSGRGGGIGQALPGALGVKLAHPGRPVLAISGDGSAMYSVQALWSAAHHDLAVVFLILDNGEYRILKHNLDTYRQRFGAKPEGPYPHMDLGSPAIGWCDIARGLGVAATRVDRPEEVAPALRAALASGRPHLLDVAVEGRG